MKKNVALLIYIKQTYKQLHGVYLKFVSGKAIINVIFCIFARVK